MSEDDFVQLLRDGHTVQQIAQAIDRHFDSELIDGMRAELALHFISQKEVAHDMLRRAVLRTAKQW